MKKKRLKKQRDRFLVEGASQTLDVRSLMGDISASLPSEVLRYLKAKPGDKLIIVARNGAVEITPSLTIQEEIEKFVSI